MILTENNFIIYAARNYTNYNCISDEDFYEDLDRIKYLKKLFTTYRKKGEIKDRLVMNHLMILMNVFNAEALVKILFFKLEKDLDLLIPFLKSINMLPATNSTVDAIKSAVNSINSILSIQSGSSTCSDSNVTSLNSSITSTNSLLNLQGGMLS